MAKNRSTKGIVVLSAIGVLSAGVGFGIAAAASAANPTNTPSSGSSSETPISAQSNNPDKVDWPTNSGGETYGSEADVTETSGEPDLIRAVASNGKTGYIRSSELAAINGSSVRSAEEALAWNKKVEELRATGKTLSVPVYEADGVSVIGDFFLDLNTKVDS